jgi:hypothetical protein
VFVHRVPGSVVVCVLLAGLAQAKQFAYPTKGQSAQQQQRDQTECYGWAKGQTGYDPAAGVLAVATANQPQGRAVRTQSADDPASAGVFGGMQGSAKQKRGQAEAAQAAADQDFRQAYGVCLEGRGYTVK